MEYKQLSDLNLNCLGREAHSLMLSTLECQTTDTLQCPIFNLRLSFHNYLCFVHFTSVLQILHPPVCIVFIKIWMMFLCCVVFLHNELNETGVNMAEKS